MFDGLLLGFSIGNAVGPDLRVKKIPGFVDSLVSDLNLQCRIINLFFAWIVKSLALNSWSVAG